jgi:hypothetical protein
MARDVQKIDSTRPIKVGGAFNGPGGVGLPNSDNRYITSNDVLDTVKQDRWDETDDSLPFTTGSFQNRLAQLTNAPSHITSLHLHNPGSAGTAYLHFYDRFSSGQVVVGTTQPVAVYAAPANLTTDLPLTSLSQMQFSSGIVLGVFGTYNGTGLLANGANVTLGYRYGHQ